MKSSKVCITKKSTLASPLFKGLATKHTTVKWIIKMVIYTFLNHRGANIMGLNYSVKFCFIFRICSFKLKNKLIC